MVGMHRRRKLPLPTEHFLLVTQLYKLSNYLHHLEYEKTETTVETLTSSINENKVLYHHNADKRNNKWNSSISLIKVEDNELPAYLINNKNKYINFID